jgi:hypothetical protein
MLLIPSKISTKSSYSVQHLAMVNTGTKRGSPGADVEKSFMDVDLSQEDALRLQVVQKDITRVEVLLGK